MAGKPLPINVEPSVFHRGDYVGYGRNARWNIRRWNGHTWQATAVYVDHEGVRRVAVCHGRTLEIIGRRIDEGVNLV